MGVVARACDTMPWSGWGDPNENGTTQTLPRHTLLATKEALGGRTATSPGQGPGHRKWPAIPPTPCKAFGTAQIGAKRGTSQSHTIQGKVGGPDKLSPAST